MGGPLANGLQNVNATIKNKRFSRIDNSVLFTNTA
jgi:hypothetical protein